MNIPTLSKTWIFQANKAYAGAGSGNGNFASMLFDIKEALLGNGSWTDSDGNAAASTGNWTVVGSGNGTVAGLDGYDRILSVADWRMGFGQEGWIVLRNTAIGSNFEVCLSGDEKTSSEFRAVFSLVGFGAANGGTDGDLYDPPTAVDEIDHQPFFTVPSATSTNARFHYMKSTDGTIFRLFICANGICCGFISIEKPAAAVTGWTNPFFAASETTSNWLTSQLTLNNLDTAEINSIYNGSVMEIYYTAEGLDSGGSFANQTSTGGLFDNSMTLYPIGLGSGTAGASGRHGTVADMWVAVDLLPDGATYPSDGSKNFIQFGGLVVPWNTTVPLLSS